MVHNIEGAVNGGDALGAAGQIAGAVGDTLTGLGVGKEVVGAINNVQQGNV